MAEKEKEVVEETEEPKKKSTSSTKKTSSKAESNKASTSNDNKEEKDEKKSIEEHLSSKAVGMVLFILTIVGAALLIFIKICAICGWYIYVLSEILKIVVLLCSALAVAGCVYKYSVSKEKDTDKTNLIYLFVNAFILLLLCV